ncbi:MAG: hypothetical protein L3J18_15940 [Candidatus Brocadia sp.]|jgi:hypothetical protein|nr:MAG: hypothetical protein L3J18_15940 [Candidatus Brocadia sp.]
MTKKEYAERNIGMTFDFIRQIIDHPEIIDTIPDNAELDFMDKDMPVNPTFAIRAQKSLFLGKSRQETRDIQGVNFQNGL